jgi:hypothetical protein
MIKFIIPAIIIFVIILFWGKITKTFYKKFNVNLNYLLACATLLTITIIFLLIKN